MADIQLVIKISEEIYKEAISSGYSHLYDEEVATAVSEGTPLDDVIEEYVERGAITEEMIMLNKIDSIKAEIKEQKSKRALQDDDLHWYREGINDVLVIIDKHIEDMQGKSCSTCKCYTCKNNDDELSGECYECIKGIFDHYEPYESEDKK